MQALLTGASILQPDQLQAVRVVMSVCLGLCRFFSFFYVALFLVAGVCAHLVCVCNPLTRVPACCDSQLAIEAGVVPPSTPVEAVQSLLTPRTAAMADAKLSHFDFSTAMPPPPTPTNSALDLDAADIAEFFNMPSPFPRSSLNTPSSGFVLAACVVWPFVSLSFSPPLCCLLCFALLLCQCPPRPRKGI